MKDVNRFQGTRAEHLGRALFLTLMTPAPPNPDSGDDLLLSPREENYRSVTFRAQIKDAHSFRVRKPLLSTWLNEIHLKPVLLLRVHPRDVNTQSYELCVLHDLLLRNAAWIHARLSKPSSTVVIRGSFFDPIDRNGAVLRDAIARESDRVLGRDSMWVDGKSRALPLVSGDLPVYLGRLLSIEVPLSVIQTVEQTHRVSCQAFGYMRECLRDHATVGRNPQSEIVRWLRRIDDDVPTVTDIQDEAAEFARFVRAVRAYERGERFDFPSHRWAEIARWRVFFTLFPATCALISEVLHDHAERWNEPQFRAALYLSAAVSHSMDKAVGNRLIDDIREVNHRVAGRCATGFEDYRILRAVQFARAQAEGGRQAKELQSFIHGHRTTGWEREVNNQYYGSDLRTSVSALGSILSNPKPRDIHTLPVIEQLFELLKSEAVKTVSGTNRSSRIPR